MVDFGHKTDRGWKFSDLYDFKIVNHDQSSLSKLKDNYVGAFKPSEGGQTHPTGLGTVPGTTQQNSAPSTGLVIKIAATHAGLITRNNGFYMPDKMRSGASTWTEHYNKPIQVHHNDHADPIGRVVAARYVDTTQQVVDEFRNSVLRDSYNNQVGLADQKFWDAFNSPKTSFIKKLEMVRLMDSVLQDPHYQGVGYIELTANITDRESIEKILDGRYLTGSVGAVSDRAICSVCNTDWLESDHCGHKPGMVYDGKKCMVIAGNLEYDEYSFVNTPADRHSGIQHIENSTQSQDETVKFFPVFTDKEASGMSAAIKDSVSSETQTTQEEVKPAESTQQDSATPSVQEDQFTVLMDKLLSDGTLSSEEHDSLYQFQLDEMDKEVIEDAKLSTAKRKKLASSAFCGPGKSFPVPDCAHVTAARRLIGRYKGPGDKSAILACVARKAKAMGCASDEVQVTEQKVQDSQTEQPKVEDQVTTEVNTQPEVIAPLYAVTSIENFKDQALRVVDGKLDIIDLETLVDGVVAERTKELEDEVVRNEEVICDLRDQLAALRKELKASYDDTTILTDNLVVANEQLRSIKTDKLQLLHTLDNTLTDDVKASFTNISDEVLDANISSLSAKVDIVKIADRLNNGLSRTPNEKIEVPAGLTEPIAETVNNKPTFATQRMVDQVYRQILLSQGYAQAQVYYRDMVKQGLAEPRQ